MNLLFLELGARIAALSPIQAAVLLRPLQLWAAALDFRRRHAPGVRGLAKRNEAFYETVWREAARGLDMDVTASADGILELRRDDVRTRVHRNETPLDDIVTLRLAGNKPAVHRRLARAGLPVPDHLAFHVTDWRAAERFRRRTGVCVVKPARDTSGGRGVTVGIADRRSLVQAVVHAAAAGPDLLIEREVPGAVYRLLVLDGVVLDAVERRRPSVVGDGRSTIRQLVRRENDRRQRARPGRGAQTLLGDDVDLDLALRGAGRSRRTVPADGDVVPVRGSVSDNSDRENYPALQRIGDETMGAAAEAAAALGIRLAGVDIVTPDGRRPLADVGGVILEVNTTPGFYHHYVRNGPPARVAVPILEALIAAARIPSRARGHVPG